MKNSVSQITTQIVESGEIHSYCLFVNLDVKKFTCCVMM